MRKSFLILSLILTLLLSAVYADDIKDIIAKSESDLDKMNSAIKEITIQYVIKNKSGGQVNEKYSRKGKNIRIDRGYSGNGTYILEVHPDNILEKMKQMPEFENELKKLPKKTIDARIIKDGFQWNINLQGTSKNYYVDPNKWWVGYCRDFKNAGSESIVGRDCLLIRSELQEPGQSCSVWIEKNSYLVIKNENKYSDTNIVTRIMSDFRKIKADYSIPFQTVTMINGEPEQTVIIKSIDYGSLDDDIFNVDKAIIESNQKEYNEVMNKVIPLGSNKKTFLDSTAPQPELKDNLEITIHDMSGVQLALSDYYEKNKKWPQDLDDYVFKNLIYFNPGTIPPESLTGSNRISNEFDGKGGWCYDRNTGRISINVKGKSEKGIDYNNY